MIYLIGSLRNPKVPEIAICLREAGHNVFDDWWSAGPEADDKWQEHCLIRGMNYQQALATPHADCVFEFDKKWLSACDTVVLAMPAGKSACIELGWAMGQGKRGFVLFDREPERFDVMFRFATGVVFSVEELLEEL